MYVDRRPNITSRFAQKAKVDLLLISMFGKSIETADLYSVAPASTNVVSFKAILFEYL